MLKMAFTYSLNLFLELGQLCFAENFTIFSSATLIQKLYSALDEVFEKASCIAPRHDINSGFRFGELGGHCFFLLNHLQTVHVQTLLSDTCCVHRAPCISLNLPLCPAAVGCSLQAILEAEINKRLQLLFAKH